MEIPGKKLFMKIPTVEKVVITILIVALIVMVISIRSCNRMVSEEGGFRQMIVNMGKEVKSIKSDIAEE